MSKITLPSIAGFQDLSKVNQNFKTIEQYLNEYVLFRNNTSSDPNRMHNELDMDSNPIYNLPKPLQDHEPVRLKDLKDITGGGGDNEIDTSGGVPGMVVGISQENTLKVGKLRLSAQAGSYSPEDVIAPSPQAGQVLTWEDNAWRAKTFTSDWKAWSNHYPTALLQDTSGEWYVPKYATMGRALDAYIGRNAPTTTSTGIFDIQFACGGAIGTEASGAVAIGIGGTASGAGSLVVTSNAYATGTTIASGEASVAIGSGAVKATGQGSLAFGSGTAEATAPSAIAINGISSGEKAIAIKGTATGNDSVAIGYLSTTNHSQSVALGSYTTTTKDEQVSVGYWAEAQNKWIKTKLISGVTDPVDPQDAATKAYVDANSGGGGGVDFPTENKSKGSVLSTDGNDPRWGIIRLNPYTSGSLEPENVSIADVDITSPADSQVLTYHAASGKWTNKSIPVPPEQVIPFNMGMFVGGDLGLEDEVLSKVLLPYSVKISSGVCSVMVAPTAALSIDVKSKGVTVATVDFAANTAEGVVSFVDADKVYDLGDDLTFTMSDDASGAESLSLTLIGNKE